MPCVDCTDPSLCQDVCQFHAQVNSPNYWRNHGGRPPVPTLTQPSHGHVVPRADGAKARCGGPAFCATCQWEQRMRAAHEEYDSWLAVLRSQAPSSGPSGRVTACGGHPAGRPAPAVPCGPGGASSACGAPRPVFEVGALPYGSAVDALRCALFAARPFVVQSAWPSDQALLVIDDALQRTATTPSVLSIECGIKGLQLRNGDGLNVNILTGAVSVFRDDDAPALLRGRIPARVKWLPPAPVQDRESGDA